MAQVLTTPRQREAFEDFAVRGTTPAVATVQAFIRRGLVEVDPTGELALTADGATLADELGYFKASDHAAGPAVDEAPEPTEAEKTEAVTLAVVDVLNGADPHSAADELASKFRTGKAKRSGKRASSTHQKIMDDVVANSPDLQPEASLEEVPATDDTPAKATKAPAKNTIRISKQVRAHIATKEPKSAFAKSILEATPADDGSVRVEYAAGDLDRLEKVAAKLAEDTTDAVTRRSARALVAWIARIK